MRKIFSFLTAIIFATSLWGAAATVYTSNVTLDATGGTRATASTAAISSTNYSAMKLGSNGNSGNFNITVPANTATLTLHAAGWNGKSNTLTLTTSATGVSISPSGAQTLTANSGVSGSSSTYTITPDNTKEFFTYTLTGVTAATTINLACNERCLIWGVNAEVPTDDPTLSASPTTINFGTVYKDADVEDQTVAVTFANLTGSVTYSGLAGTVFEATGSISATGDEITISADASTIGEYEETLTIESADDSKSVDVTITMNVVAAPEPTGTFELYSGAIEEGDYVIYYNGYAMDTTVSSNRLQYKTVTPSDNKIVNPDEAIIWHIAPISKTSYWNIYNAKANKFAAATGSKNQAQMLADGTDNKAKWTVTGDRKYEFENLARSTGSDSGNKWLRNNGTNGFACYASGTGDSLILYRKNAPSVSAVTNEETPAPLAELNLGDVGQTWDASITFGLSCKKMVAAQSPLTLTVPDGFTFNISTGVKTQTIAVSDGTNAISDITIYKNTTTAGNINTNLTITGGGLTEAVNIPLKMNVHAPEVTVTKNESPLTTLDFGTYYRYSFNNVAKETIKITGQYLPKYQEMMLKKNSAFHFEAVRLESSYDHVWTETDGTLDLNVVVKGYTNNSVGTHEYIDDDPEEGKYEVYLEDTWGSGAKLATVYCKMTIVSAYAVRVANSGTDEENGYQIKVYDNSDKLQDSTITNYDIRGYVNNENDLVVITPVPAVGYAFDSWNYSGDASHIDVITESKAQLRIKADQAVYISGTFTKVCDPLDAPEEVAGYPTLAWNGYHYTATFKWNAVANATDYALIVHNVADGASHARDFERDLDDMTVSAGVVTCELSGLLGEAEYEYSIMAVGSGDYCTENALTENTLETEDWPAATLTLSENGKNRAWGEDLKVASQIALPTSVETGVVDKVLVGWSAVTIAETNTKPTSDFYAPGATYTIETTADKLYAVYGTSSSTTWELTSSDITKLSDSGSGYAPYNGDRTKDGIKFTTSAVMPGSGGNDGKIQMQASNGMIYNQTAFAKDIKSIAIDGVNLAVFEGTDTIDATPGNGAITKSDGVYPFTAGNRYFHLKKNTSGAGYANSIIVTLAGDTTAYATSGARVLDTPTFLPAEGKKTSVTNVTISATEGTIYYTINGDDPTNASTAYSSAIVLSENGTYVIKAIAIDAQNNQSEIATATYTIELPLTTMDEICAKAKDAGGTATDVNITFNNWIVTATTVSNAYVSDGTKGFIIYQASHSYAVKNKLNGTVACKVKLNNGAPQVSSIGSGLTITNVDTIIPVVKEISELDTVNTGALVTIQGVTYDGTNSVLTKDAASIKPWTTLYTGSYTDGKKYDITGIYLQYNATKEILPRKAADIAVSTPTGFDNLESDVKAVKVLKDGQIFILRGDKTYTIQGQLVK